MREGPPGGVMKRHCMGIELPGSPLGLRELFDCHMTV